MSEMPPFVKPMLASSHYEVADFGLRGIPESALNLCVCGKRVAAPAQGGQHASLVVHSESKPLVECRIPNGAKNVPTRAAQGRRLACRCEQHQVESDRPAPIVGAEIDTATAHRRANSPVRRS